MNANDGTPESIVDQGREQDGAEHVSTTALPAIGSVLVPSPQQFEIVRSEAREAGKSQDLHRMVSAMQAAAAKCDVAYEEMVRLAIYRLEVERDLGAHLAQTVARGRPAKRCPGGTIPRSGLPDGVSKKQSATYQRLAAIPPVVFQRYLGLVRKEPVLPTTRGAQSFAHEEMSRDGGPARKARVSRAIVSARLALCIQRCLGDIDVVVGCSSIPARQHIATLDGFSVGDGVQKLVLASPQVGRALSLASGLVGSGKVSESIVLLPRNLDSGWLCELKSGRWSLALPLDSAAGILAHVGAKARAFHLVFAGLGPIFESPLAAVQQQL